MMNIKQILAEIINCNQHFTGQQMVAIEQILNAQPEDTQNRAGVAQIWLNYKEKILAEFKSKLADERVLIVDFILRDLEQILNAQPESEYNLPITEVHGWDRPLTKSELDERYELQKQGKISISTCDCDFCKHTRKEIAKRMIEGYRKWVAQLRPEFQATGTLDGFENWLDKEE